MTQEHAMELEEWLEFDDLMEMPTGAGPVAVRKYAPPRHKLPVRLFDTEYEVGILHLSVPADDGPDHPGVKAHTTYMLDLVMHPERGVLNVGCVSMDSGAERLARWEQVYENLSSTCDVLRTQLCIRSANGECHDYWSDRALPFGPAIVDFGGGPAAGPRPAEIDDGIVVPGDWESLPERLGEVMDHHGADCDGDERYLARNLATALKTTDAGIRAEYIDHVGALAAREAASEQLFGGSVAAA